MKLRRTFCVRVSSPSSASSSLWQDQEAPDLRARHHLFGGQRAVHLVDVVRQHVVDPRMAGKLLIGAVDDVVALRPVADRGEIDVEHGADEIALVAEGDRLADVGIEFQLVLDVFRREQRAVVEAADILGAIDDLQVAALGIEEAGVAGLDVAVGRAHFGGLGVVLEIADEHAGRFELHLAARRRCGCRHSASPARRCRRKSVRRAAP